MKVLKDLTKILVFLIVSIQFHTAMAEDSCEIIVDEHQYDSFSGYKNSPLLRLDVHSSDCVCTEPRNLLVYVHGGGWVSGDKKDITEGNKEIVSFFVNRGFVFASINYRLFLDDNPSKVTLSDQAEDVASAIAWLHENKELYNIDPSKTFLYGHSAGAHLVSLVSTDKSYLNAKGLNLKDIQGVISSDVHAYDVPEAIKLMFYDPVLKRNIGSLKKKFGYTVPAQDNLSPMSYINNYGIPDFLIFSAGYPFSGDLGPSNVSNKMSAMFKDGLKRKKVDADHFHYSSLSHTDLVQSKNMGKESGALSKKVDAFLAPVEKPVCSGYCGDYAPGETWWENCPEWGTLQYKCSKGEVILVSGWCKDVAR